MNKDTLRQLAIVLAVVATIIVNGLATALPINGQTTGEISDSFDVFFVPAGYVFSIWGLIYLGLIAYAVYQALPAQKENAVLQSIGLPFIVGSLANIAWILLWHYEIFPLTLIAMLVLLGTLIVIYLRLNIGRGQVSSGMRWLVHLPFSIYLGWITVATVANATALLAYLEWDGWGIAPETWTIIMLLATVIIASLMSLTRGDIAYALVIIWALVGIALKHSDNDIVAAGAWISVILVAIMMIVGAFRHRQKGQQLAPAG